MKRLDFAARVQEMDTLLGAKRSFDMTTRALRLGTRNARLWVVNGYADDAVLERMIAVWLSIPDWRGVYTLEDFVSRYVRARSCRAVRSSTARLPGSETVSSGCRS